MKRRAFTILELVIVVALIAILAYLVTTSLLKMREKAKLSRVSNELSSIATSVTQYYQDNNYTYPADVDRAVPPGLEKYLAGGVWPTSVWPHGVFDWDNWVNNGQHVYQISYRLCDLNDPIEYCSDPILFPNFTRYSSIFYCISGPCVPHRDHPTDPGYCVNCTPHEVNY
jgi:prepilin-type N-terminal cleavage/methylation domain-containing protein